MDDKIKLKIVRRLRIIEGQVKGLQKMIEADKYCIDIIRQSQAVKEALSGVEDLLLENHLKTHALHQMKHGKESKTIKEILYVYNVSKRK